MKKGPQVLKNVPKPIFNKIVVDFDEKLFVINK